LRPEETSSFRGPLPGVVSCSSVSSKRWRPLSSSHRRRHAASSDDQGWRSSHLSDYWFIFSYPGSAQQTSLVVPGGDRRRFSLADWAKWSRGLKQGQGFPGHVGYARPPFQGIVPPFSYPRDQRWFVCGRLFVLNWQLKPPISVATY
jgi:hypothetical protein